MTTQNIYYINNVFKYPELTKIVGQPTYVQLKKIKNECAANALQVHSNLGGGAHGLLGLVLTATEYALVSNTPFVRPVHPGPLTLPVGNNVTNLQQETAQDTHKEAVRIFQEVTQVEKALL